MKISLLFLLMYEHLTHHKRLSFSQRCDLFRFASLFKVLHNLLVERTHILADAHNVHQQIHFYDSNIPQKMQTCSPCFTLPRLASPCFTLYHLASPCLTLLHLASPCFTLPRLASPCVTLYHLASLCLTLLHLASPCRTLPHLASPCFTTL